MNVKIITKLKLRAAIDLFLKKFIILLAKKINLNIRLFTEVLSMKKETLIIAILVALIILWITETIGMKKTSRLLSGAIDIGFSLLR